MESIKMLLESTLSSYEKKEYEKAEKGVDEMRAKHPDLNQALFLKAVILEETGRAKEAEEYYKKAGSSYTLWLRLALQLQEKDPARSLIYFKKTSEMDPENNMIWFELGAVQEKLGRANDAKKSYANISLKREIITKLLSPLGFLIIMVAGSIAMFQRGNFALGSLVVVSGIVCLLWLKRDGGKVLQMMKKKKKFA
jgi:tetratricopeptide (TPR) repeat protein